MLEAQDKARSNALKALFDKTHLRAQVAGESAVRAAKEREEEELARISALQEERAAEQAAAAAAKREKAAAVTRDQMAVLDVQMAEKAAAEKAKAEELRAHSRAVTAADEAHAREQARKAAERKAKDEEHAAFLKAQSASKSAAKNVSHLMTPEERARASCAKHCLMIPRGALTQNRPSPRSQREAPGGGEEAGCCEVSASFAGLYAGASASARSAGTKCLLGRVARVFLIYLCVWQRCCVEL